MYKELTKEQIEAYNEAAITKERIDNAEETLISILNLDRDSDDSVFSKEQIEEIYPQLWDVLVERTSNVIQDVQKVLVDRVKENVKKLLEVDSTLPIVPKKEREEVEIKEDEQTTINTTVSTVYIKDKYKTGEYEEIVSSIFDDIKSNEDYNVNGIYDEPNDIEYYKTNVLTSKWLKDIITNKEFKIKDYQEMVKEMCETSNIYVVIDIINTAFDLPKRLANDVIVIKCNFVAMSNKSMQAQEQISNGEDIK